MRLAASSGISSRFRKLSRAYRQVTHVLLTHPPLVPQSSLPKEISLLPALDLHVLGTPPAFVLSQDQTLHKSRCETHLIIEANRLRLKFSLKCLLYKEEYFLASKIQIDFEVLKRLF